MFHPRQPRHAGLRSRSAALGAALAVTLGAGGLLHASAADTAGTGASVFVPITPCRLLDTRPAGLHVGERLGALGAKETVTIAGRGKVGTCNLPTNATGLALNVAVVNGTASSYLTVFPAGPSVPLAANLNWIAAQAPTPNAVQTALSSDGKLSFYNLSGSVDLAVDVDGYYLGADDLYAKKSDLATTQSDLAAAQTDLAATKTGLAAAQGDLTTVHGEIGSLQTDVLAHTELLTTLDQQVSQLNADTPIEGQRVTQASNPANLAIQRHGAPLSVTTGSDGTWRLSLDVNVTIESCAQPSVQRAFYLVVDDVVVADSIRNSYRDDVRGFIHFSGTTPDAIPAGTHTVELGFSCLSQNSTAFDVENTQVLDVDVLP